MAGLFSQFLDFLFPPRCTFCRRFLANNEREICKDCLNALPYAKKGDFIKGEHFSHCVCSFRYEGYVKDAIRRYKFKGQVAYAGCFGKMLAKTIRDNLAGRYDIITWIPVSTSRLKTRGYDQSMLLAYAAANELEDVAAEIIRKTSDVPAQSGLVSKAQRKKNVLGAFEVVDAELAEGKRVLVIDDVVTTGATLNECAKILKEAGASEVICAALATAGGIKIGDDV